MTNKRTKFSPAVKPKVAIEAIRERETLARLAMRVACAPEDVRTEWVE